jgi:hypothetical protein
VKKSPLLQLRGRGDKGRFSINIVNIINKISIKFIKPLFYSPLIKGRK